MKIPTEKHLRLIKKILKKSIDELISNDSEIFNTNVVIPERISLDAKILNRELHETTINHRLAFYIEKNIQNTVLSIYNVDIEYNRYYENLKILNTIEKQLTVRPDIIVHTRINNKTFQQHFLVIETKKAKISKHDIKKINGFISDQKYQYLFGLTISYCIDVTQVLANLYYFNGEEIVIEKINRPK